MANTCGLCGGPMSAVAVEVRDGHRCIRCGEPMRLAFAMDGNTLAVPDPRDIWALVQKGEVRLARRRGGAGLVHICPRCGERQEAAGWLRETTRLVKTISASTCRKCGYWIPEGWTREWLDHPNTFWMSFIVVAVIVTIIGFINQLHAVR